MNAVSSEVAYVIACALGIAFDGSEERASLALLREAADDDAAAAEAERV